MILRPVSAAIAGRPASTKLPVGLTWYVILPVSSHRPAPADLELLDHVAFELPGGGRRSLRAAWNDDRVELGGRPFS